FYVGTANKDYFIKHGLAPSQLVYAPHAIDNMRFQDDGAKNYENQAREWRKELGYRPEDIVLLFAGKFESVKQPELLIQAVKQTNISLKNPIQLLMVGNGPLENDLKWISQSDANIQFLDFQNQTQMPIVYRLGTIFCLPSKSE